MIPLVSAILPRDLWEEVLSYSFEPFIFEKKAFSSYEYIKGTLTGNTKKDNYLRHSPEEFEELEAKKSKIAKINSSSWLKNIGTAELQTYVDTVRDLMKTIMKTDNINMLKYLHNSGRLSDHMLYSYAMLNNACKNGSFDIFKYMMKIVNQTREKSLHDIGWAIEYAGENGHLKIIEHLVKLFELTNITDTDWKKLGIARIYRSVCYKGHTQILEYLKRTFRISLMSLYDVDKMLESAVTRNDRNLFGYLVSSFDLTNNTASGLFDIKNIYYSSLGQCRYTSLYKPVETFMTMYIRQTFKSIHFFL